MKTRLLLAIVLTLLPSLHGGWSSARLTALAQAPVVPAAPSPEEDAQAREFIKRIEQIVQTGSVGTYLALLAPDADRTKGADFAIAHLRPGATRVVVKERDRLKVDRDGEAPLYRIAIDVFAEFGDKARVATWLIDVEPSPTGWFINAQEPVSEVEQLYRLSLAKARQFDGTNVVVRAEDLTLTLQSGSILTIETVDGTTGALLVGTGDLRFAPTSATEKSQVRIFNGADDVASRFESAYIRFGKADDHLDLTALTERPVDPRLLKRAEQVFRVESAKSYILDLGDLSRDAWSLLPGDDDFLAEVRTKKLGTLTYARAWSEPEDIAFFQRQSQRNISVYASKAKLAQRGRFYDEDDPVTFDVLHYDLDLTMQPDRLWLEGTTQMRIRMKTTVANQLTLKLADSLVVHSVVSDRFGRLFSLRVKGQDTVLVNLPSTMLPGSELLLTIDYAGRLEPQPPNRENLQQGFTERDPQLPPDIIQRFLNRIEPSYLYSNRSYWYPQSTVTDYATAVMHITVPSPYVCVASGTLQPQSPTFVTAVGPEPGRLYRFRADRPVRYLSFVVSRFERMDSTTLTFDSRSLPASTVPERLGPNNVVMRLAAADPATARPAPSVYTTLQMTVEANPRQRGRAREDLAAAAEVAKFYDSVLGDLPYESFTLALTEDTMPGGHSPGYFAVLNQPLPNSGGTFWSDDPAAFENYPEFFLAHEIAHQWWGQAIGWRNYHEQWLSEGFSQYFAAMYAGRLRGAGAFSSVLTRMRRTALEKNDQGPVYLGYRLGHIFNDGRVHRALVYNKGGAVLHMLRRLLGDDAFFKGLRRFYADWRYRKASTEDFRVAMEEVSGRSLERFFDRWVYGATLPAVRWSWRTESGEGGPELAVHVEQTGDVFDFALPLTLSYQGRPAGTIAVPVTDRIADFRMPLPAPLNGVEFDRGDGPLFDADRLP